MIGSTRNSSMGGATGVSQSSISMMADGSSAGLRAQVQAGAAGEGSIGNIPFAVVAIAIVYLVWAFVIQHERVKESLQPANIAANLHNWFVIGVGALGFLLLGKLATVKGAAVGIPGMATLARIFAAV